jgi:predicted nucleic acid-binding protein
MGVLGVTERTADEAASLQAELIDRGVPLDPPDALFATSAREHGDTLLTAEKPSGETRYGPSCRCPRPTRTDRRSVSERVRTR